MEEDVANYLVDTEIKYLDLVPKFGVISSNYMVIKALDLQAEKFHSNQLNTLLEERKILLRQNKVLKVVIVVGSPIMFIGGVAAGTAATIKLSEYIFDHLKKTTSSY